MHQTRAELILAGEERGGGPRKGIWGRVPPVQGAHVDLKARSVPGFGAHGASGAVGAVEPLRLLLVEDSPSDTELTIEALREAKLGNHLSVVEDGVQARAVQLQGDVREAFEGLEDVTVLGHSTAWNEFQDHLRFGNVDAVAVIPFDCASCAPGGTRSPSW